LSGLGTEFTCARTVECSDVSSSITRTSISCSPPKLRSGLPELATSRSARRQSLTKSDTPDAVDPACT
jgi:hypothetical protein